MRGLFVSGERLMKNICVSIGLITILSGCGSSVESWRCEIGTKEPTITEYVTVDLKNKTWEFFEGRVSPYYQIEDKMFSRYINRSGTEMTVTLDRHTGEYATGNEEARIIMGKCDKT